MICILQKRAAASTTTSTSSVSTKYLPPTLKEIAIEEREKWIQQNEHLEQDPLTRGPHYLRGHRHPFPLNPLYKPIAPLSHSTRLAITEAYSQGTALPEIGMKYGISLLRVHGMCHPPFIIKIIKAIIKLGIIAKDWTSKGIPLQFNLQENMERLLGAQDRTNSSEKLVPMEKLKPLPSQRVIFNFMFVING